MCTTKALRPNHCPAWSRLVVIADCAVVNSIYVVAVDDTVIAQCNFNDHDDGSNARREGEEFRTDVS